MEVEAAMRRIHGLSTSEQLKVFLHLRAYLGDAVGEETEADKEIRERGEALDAMRKVAEHLGLPPGVPPKNAAYKKVPKDVAPEWSATRVGDVWGRYRTAERAYRGERVPESPGQRSHRRGHSGKARAGETYFAGVRQWLETEPASVTTKDYDGFARDYNAKVLAGRQPGPRLVLSGAVGQGTALGWYDVVAVARRDAEFERLQRQRVEERLEANGGPLGVIAVGTVALILGCNKSEVTNARVRGDAFPVAVLNLGRTHAWVADDVRAHRDGKPYPRRAPGAMQHLVMGAEELADRLGYTADSLRVARHNKATSVPQEDGRIGQTLYWLRANVDAWEKANAGRTRRPPRPDKRGPRST
jgi:hypothetical protein